MTNDLISREAAIDEIRDIWCYDCHCATNKRDCKACNAGYCIDALRDLPAVDAAPVVHGWWIVQDRTYTRFACSACRARNFSDRTNFCPNCGARVDGDSEC